jgi:uncharacterized protein
MRFSAFASVLCLGLSLAVAPAVSAEEAATEHSVKAAASGPAMWKVADEDTTIYLFGTVHILPKEVEWMDETISAALASSDILVTELPMDPAADAEMQQLTMTKGMLPKGTTLRSLLTEDQVKTYEAAFKKIGFPTAAAAQFDSFKPWFAGLTFSMLPLLQQGYSPDKGVEKVLLSEAGSIERGALETAEFQLGIFDNLPQPVQISFLMETIEGIDEVKTSLDQMVDAWVKGDADALAAIMNEGMGDPEFADALLYSRNANWAEWIEARLVQPGTVFIAVGAGHLAGEKSVQDMLAAKGIEAARIK